MTAKPSRRSPSGPPADVWKRPAAVRRAGNQLLRLLPISVYRRLAPRGVVGLCYHVVSSERLPHVAELYRYKTPAQFESDLLYLKRHFHLPKFEEIAAGRSTGSRKVPSAIVTFDDGLAECYSVVRPLLLEHGVPCIFFVTPGVLGNRRMFAFDQVSLCIGALQERSTSEAERALARASELLGAPFPDVPAFADWITRWIRTVDDEGERRLERLCGALGVDVEGYLRRYRPYMTEDEVKALAGDGFTIGGHALRHVALGELRRPEEVEEHIVGSCAAVRELTGAERVPFAFPFDADGVDRDHLAGVLERHPDLGPLFDTRRLRVDRDFIVNRMIVDAPPALRRESTNLPTYLRGAYWEELVVSARGWTRRARPRGR